jgi:hypothetical protein
VPWPNTICSKPLNTNPAEFAGGAIGKTVLAVAVFGVWVATVGVERSFEMVPRRPVATPVIATAGDRLFVIGRMSGDVARPPETLGNCFISKYPRPRAIKIPERLFGMRNSPY